MARMAKEMNGTSSGQSRKPQAGGRGRPAGTEKAALSDIAEMLFKVAVNCCDQHQRYAELVKRAARETEQRAAVASVQEADDILDEAVDLYELACLRETNHADDAWWHKANMVWRGAKEYLQHHAPVKRSSRFDNGHSRADLMELEIENELQASALLHLRHAVDSYQAAKPQTESAGRQGSRPSSP